MAENGDSKYHEILIEKIRCTLKGKNLRKSEETILEVLEYLLPYFSEDHKRTTTMWTTYKRGMYVGGLLLAALITAAAGMLLK